jgi:acyl-CoA synthetase (NDP forming)
MGLLLSREPPAEVPRLVSNELEEKQSMKDLSKIFNPRSIAVVGDKKISDYRWLKSLTEFKGNVYHVNVDRNEWPGAEALGFKNYASLLDIEEPIDYVIVSVPAAVAPRVLADCVKKRVGAVHMFTAGFDEAGTAEGDRLAATIKQQAAEGDFHIVGPNCFGAFVPGIGIKQTPMQYAATGGNVAFVSQSGSQSMAFAQATQHNGILISKMVSYGNGIVLDCSDYIEYLGTDEETEVIGVFLEGTRDQERFFEILGKVARRKPVLIWKAGQTIDGARSVTFHSATETQAPDQWEATVSRCGALSVSNLEEMVDTIKILLFSEPPKGNRVALLAPTGGHATEMTDNFAKEGLSVPPLSERSYEKLSQFFDTVGGSYRNPFDGFGSGFAGDRTNLARILEILNEDENIDAVHYAMQLRDAKGIEQQLEFLADFRRKSKKPLLVTIPIYFPYWNAEGIRPVVSKLTELKIPVFPTYGRAALGLRNVVDYYQNR